MELKYPLVLASGSPRRKELLEKLQLPFSVETVEVDETIPEHIKPSKAAIYLAKVKSEAHSHLAKNQIVITADTIVTLNGQSLGKPSSAEEAVKMLKKLSGRTHKVITGVCIRLQDQMDVFDVTTKVTFGELEENDIQTYVQSGNAFDKAGAYGIQEWIGLIGVKSIEGCYYNVMGLPVFELYNKLKNFRTH
ncbi:MAG: septum formation protein Maf [Cyclobacteriaceae bacterium]|nr:septum formation protein Maf [Cyclobacteriaceae bacterium]